MSWRRMAQPVLERADHALSARFATDVAARIDALDDTTVATEDPYQLIARIRDGWETYPFPELPTAATVRCHLGWAYTHLGTGYNPQRWRTMVAEERRELLIALMSASSFVFPTLGEYVEAIWAHVPRSRLATGAFAPMRGRVDPETFATTQFLFALGQHAPAVPAVLYAVGGLAD